MRHRHGPRKLNITDGAHRRALMRHICCALIERERINTTLPRAKELRRFIEPLITLGKRPNVHRRRIAFARLQNRDSVAKLFDDLGARFGSRPGGYVRILKNGFRKGDGAPMAMVEFVDKKPDVPAAEDAAKLAKKSAKSKKSAVAAKSAAAAADAESAQSEKSAKSSDAAAGDGAVAAEDAGKDGKSADVAAAAESAADDAASAGESPDAADDKETR